MKRCGLLQKIDYLSTVSGGGYIGAWLSANCKRNANWLDPSADWKLSIAHLRRYSNLSVAGSRILQRRHLGDGNDMAAQHGACALLTVILGIATVLIPPRLLFVAFKNWPQVGNGRWTTIILFILGVVGVAGNQLRISCCGAVGLLEAKNWRLWLCIAVAVLGAALGWGVYLEFSPFKSGPVNLSAAIPIALLLVVGGFMLQPAAVRLVHALWRGKKPPNEINYTQTWAQVVVVIPMLAVGFLVAAILWGESQPPTGDLTKIVSLSTIDSFSGFF